MQYIYGATEVTRAGGSVVILGNFDGVHKGHQRLFEIAKEEAMKEHLTTVVFSFYPHPTWIIGDNKKSLLMSRRDKKKLIESLGIDVLVEYPFTKEFARISAETFVRELLVKQLKAKVLVIGSNYFFGRDKEGDPHFLTKIGKQYGIKVHVVEAVVQNGSMISSTHIRELIREGRIEEAREMLGHPYMIVGEVIKGKQLGRTIGFPTANLEADPYRVYPPKGVYATKVKVYSNVYMGMTNIGVNPTVCGKKKMIETHLLDFNYNLYGQEIEIDFYKYIRPEIKFDNIKALKEQMMSDKHTIQKILEQM